MRTREGQADRAAAWVPAGGAAPELHVCSAVSRSVPFDLAAVVVAGDMDHRTALVGSDARLRQFGDLQQSLGEGPGQDVLRTGAPVVVTDVRAETSRWPLLTATAELPVRSLALLPLRVDRPAGRSPGNALGLLGAARSWVQPFTVSELGVLEGLAALVTQLLLDRLRRCPGSLVGRDPLPRTLGFSDDDLGTSLGMVMAAVRTDRAGALTRLRARAFVRGCTVHELATEIVAGRSPAGDDLG